ncbi:MAG TPA: alpha/beta fold hydrolase [Jatrophihabitans sp.]|nr:alpha/beta fold hydrolase [Jatrophihabitans sp.]
MTATPQTVTAPDGRQLEYLLDGPEDGVPLVFHVGTPNCAADFSVLSEPVAELGLRLICYSRPGYAGSTERPGRTVADAVEDVTVLLDALGIDRFVTAGWSGGGPHALACAALLPERCRAAAVLAGVAPFDAAGLDFLAGMGEDNVEEFGATLAGPERLQDYLDEVGPQLAAVTGESVIAGLESLLPDVDKRALTGEFADQMAANFRRALAGGVAGWRDDDLAFVRDWGFTLSKVTVPVAIWQGGQDLMVPFAHGRWLAGAIPSAQPHLLADEGHVSLVSQMAVIFADLLGLAAGR